MMILLGRGKGILPLIPAALDLHADSKVRDVSDHCQEETPWSCPITAQDWGRDYTYRNNLTAPGGIWLQFKVKEFCPL